MTTAWEKTVSSGVLKAPDACPRCASPDHREHLLQTNGVAFYRCGSCGHLFIVRSTPAATQPES